MRAIDKDDLLKYLQDHQEEPFDTFTRGVSSCIDWFLDIVELFSEIKIPQHVHCKDCKYYGMYHVCEALSQLTTVVMEPDDYCSRGERKDE